MKPIKLMFSTLLWLWLQAAGTSAVAQLTDDEFTGTLKKAKATGSIASGHREASIPFSYMSGTGEPIGYSIDLCKFLVDAIGEQVGREIVFAARFEQARRVSIAGDFNNWSPDATVMHQGRKEGEWRMSLPLQPGRYRYRLVVDGQWMTDPNNTYVEANQFGELNNVFEVDPV